MLLGILSFFVSPKYDRNAVAWVLIAACLHPTLLTTRNFDTGRASCAGSLQALAMKTYLALDKEGLQRGCEGGDG